MKAAVLHEFKKSLSFEDVPRPKADASDLLIQVDACGVCHSDLHVADGDWPQFAPITKMPGQRLAIFGIGGLGHVAVQIAKELGAEVIAVDMTDEKLRLAESLGATQSYNAASKSVAKELRAKGGVHVAMVTSAAKEAYDTAFACVRPSGMLLAVGLPPENICFPPIMMAAKEVCIQASAVGTRQDLREVLAMAGNGKVRCHVATRPLSEVNEVIEELRRGRVSGRVVLSLP